jgi:tRNA threonylcarbamoyladenosine biosynthesis protein TsaE
MSTAVTISSEAELQAYAANFVSTICQSLPSDWATIVTLSGDLGAGKTAFVKALGMVLGVLETIVSPTFVVLKTYETPTGPFLQLVHMDAYRIEDTSELLPLHFNDYVAQPKTLLCVEWPECIPEAILVSHHHIAITIIDETTRTFTHTYVKK